MEPAVERVVMSAVVVTAIGIADADFALSRESRNGSLRGGRSVIGFAMCGAGEAGDVSSAILVAPLSGDGRNAAWVACPRPKGANWMTGHGSVNGSTMTRMKKLAKNFVSTTSVEMLLPVGRNARPTPVTHSVPRRFYERNAAAAIVPFLNLQTYL
jgi:hypothetical protein